MSDEEPEADPRSSFQSASYTAESIPEEFPTHVAIKNVRISPGNMFFENAYEGKSYTQKLVIQNCGDHLAFVRLGEPNSKTFEFKSFTDGIYLSPGMKIVRTVKYTYKAALGVRKGFAMISVNGEEMDYHFTVTLSAAVLSLEPQLLDFGRIDAVNHATTLTFHIKNSGCKGSQFAIDLGRNPLELIVEPMKGMVAAMTSVPIAVEIVGSHEGEFTEEFWVKTKPPQRIVVTGVFISPKLLVRKFINSLDFTLVDFPPTYYGATSTQPLLIKNFSASHSMFCVMAELKGTTMSLDAARELDDNYKNFIINPTDGRLAAQRGAIIQMTFAPVKTSKNYSACFIKVIRMDCRDVIPSDHLSEVLNRSIKKSNGDDGSFNSLSRDNYTIVTMDAIGSITSLHRDETPPPDETFSFEHSIGVCLHGEKHQAGVILRPTLINLTDLTLNKVYQRELLVINRSEILPIKLKYNKVPSIDVIPYEFELPPDDIREVLITIRTSQLQRIEKTVTFDLFSVDYPNDKNIIRKVGRSSLKITFEATTVIQKARLDRCVLCNDLSEKLPPGFPYRLTQAQLARKNRNDDYYLKYIRSLQKEPPPVDEEFLDYSLTRAELLKLENHKCKDLVPRCRKGSPRYTPFIPLSPHILYNVRITPKSIRLRKVAAFTTITDFFEIENLNPFPIRTFMRSSKPCIVFDNNSRYVIRANKKKKIMFEFCTEKIGRYYVNINVLINESTLYEVTAVAHVVPKTLNLEIDEIVFTEDDGQYKFFKMINGLNTFTSFDWEVPQGSFQIYPQSGGIKAESFILCMVTYSPQPGESNACECVLTSESGQKRIVTVTKEKHHHAVVFDNYYIDAGLIPLNVPVRKKVTLKNLTNAPTLFNIPDGVSVPGITIKPTQGLLDGLASQVFTIEIHLKAVIEFSLDIVFNIKEEEEITVDLKGTVDYPRFSITPDMLYFRKLAPYSLDTLAFKVKNVSKCESYVTFPVEDFLDFTINESEDDPLTHQKRIALQPGQAKVFFLHFHPIYVSTYSYFLPVIFNDILGPVLINSSTTSTPQYFLKDSTAVYDNIPRVSVKKIPRLLPMVRINCCAIDQMLELSTVLIKLMYFGEDHYNNAATSEFEITNTSAEIAAVCIRIDDLKPPFTFVPKYIEVNIEFYELSYKIILEPGEKIVFEANFSPYEIGTYMIRLPIFLRHYFDDKIFNYITLEGVYGRPTITSSMDRCDFEPVPLRMNNSIVLTLHMQNHFENCSISCYCDLERMFPTFEEVNRTSPGDYYFQVTLQYVTSRLLCFDTVLTFECSCEASCSIESTGVAENCLLTTHAFSHLLRTVFPEEDSGKSQTNSEERLRATYSRPRYIDILANKNSTCYPLFPADSDHSPYAEHMRGLQRTLENWLFSQAFYLKSYYKIPEGFSDFCKVGEARQKLRFGGHKQAKLVGLPLLDLMTNIAGASVRQRLDANFPKEGSDREWMTYTSTVNSRVLYYLRGYSVFLPHVKAKYLLNYEQYLLYEQTKRPDGTPIEEETFRRLSKQCWIDLVLQIIKTFFLFRIVPVPAEEEDFAEMLHAHSSSAMSRLSTEEYQGEDVLSIGIYGKHELELVLWLEKCYDQEKNELWGTEAPDAKEVVFLDEDLRDGLFLGAATAHYCPYVKSEFKHMYPKPYNPEEVQHNVFTLVQTWKMLRLSYVFSAIDMIHGGMVEMLLLVTYLYDVLPNYFPKETITIQAPLTQTSGATIDLENLGTDPIYYQVVFFGNESQLFELGVPTDTFMIEPKSKKALKIRYHAKSVKTITTNLLLSGEAPGHKYGRTVAITLVGVADVSYACMKIPVNIDLYRPCQVVLHIESPFKVKADYALYFGYQPASKDMNVLFPWEEIKNLKNVKEFVLPDEMCQFDEEGKSDARLLFCCQQQGPRDMWLYFTNPEVGDWGIQLTVTGKVTQSCYEFIDVWLPEHYDTFVCRCKRKPSVSKNCPMILHVMIPMKNNPLWDARKMMLLQYVEGEELNFWSKRIYTPTGTRILKLIFNSETHPMKNVIEETVKYTVELDKATSPFVTLKEVVFEDVTSEDYFDLPIHPLKGMLQKNSVVLKLLSKDELERRFYKLFFKDPSEAELKISV